MHIALCVTLLVYIYIYIYIRFEKTVYNFCNIIQDTVNIGLFLPL